MLPKTLFAKTVTVIAVFSTLLLVFSLSVIGYFILIPVGKQSADDLAALMVFSAHAWSNTPDEKRKEFEHSLFSDYKLSVANNQQLKPVNFKPLPYYYFLESSLQTRTGKPVKLKISQDKNNIDWYWANLYINNQNVQLGFSSSHINARPPLVLISLLIVGALATLVTAAALVRHLTTPLERLSENAQRIGSGKKPELIPETGPEEMSKLAKSFNKMAVQVNDLLTNRTTLLAGISHDLRTPLARIQLALVMLPDETDPELVEGIRRDVEQMNCLIGQFLELSKTLEKGEQQYVDISETLNDLVNCSRRGGAEINYTATAECSTQTNPLALQRIIVNLLENAVRYGNALPVDVNCFAEKKFIKITILDRGPGIPEDEVEAVFRPFYRLDQSRNIETGGTGLGLSIALQLAELNKINIKLSNRDEGGTIAEISIPVTQQRKN